MSHLTAAMYELNQSRKIANFSFEKSVRLKIDEEKRKLSCWVPCFYALTFSAKFKQNSCEKANFLSRMEKKSSSHFVLEASSALACRCRNLYVPTLNLSSSFKLLIPRKARIDFHRHCWLLRKASLISVIATLLLVHPRPEIKYSNIKCGTVLE